MTTLADLRVAVRTRAGLPATDAMAQDDALDSLINAALQAYALEGDYPWLQAEATIPTVVDAATVAAPDGYRRINWASVDGWDLEARDRRDLSIFDRAATGRPRLYSAGQAVIHLRPIPNQVYSLKIGYQAAEPRLVDDTDEPLIPESFDDFLVAMAMLKLAVRLKDTDLVQMSQSEIEAWVRRLRREQIKSPTGLRIRTVDRGV